MPPLSVLEAVQFKERLRSGSSAPGVFLCRNSRGVSADYVVKFRTKCFRGSSGLLYEALGAKLAELLGLHTPEPALVQLSSELADALEYRPDISMLIRQNIGLNFASRYLAGYSTWPQDQDIPLALRKAASEVFAFDTIIDNGNRVADNPNLLARSSELLVIDHELAFQFLGYGGGTMDDWHRAVESRRGHPFYRVFRRAGGVVNLDRFGRRLAALHGSQLRALRDLLPVELHRDELDKILDWLQMLSSESEKRIRDIREVFIQ